MITMDAPTMAEFDAICATVAARGKGLSLLQITAASALARELSKAEPDTEKVEVLRTQLGIEAEGSD